MCNKVKAGSRTNQRIAPSQKRCKARPSSPPVFAPAASSLRAPCARPSSAAAKPQFQALSVSRARVRPLPTLLTASTGAGLPSPALWLGCTNNAVAPGWSRATRLIPCSGGSAAQRASLALGSRLSEVAG